MRHGRSILKGVQGIVLAYFLLGLSSSYVKGAEVKDWQGEWGGFTQSEKGINGGSLSIFDCDEKNRPARLHFKAVGRSVTTDVRRSTKNIPKF